MMWWLAVEVDELICSQRRRNISPRQWLEVAAVLFSPSHPATIKMFSPLRYRPPLLLKPHISSFRRLYSTNPSASGNRQTNTPPLPTPVQNVSDSNALPTSAAGAQDAPLQESTKEGERQRQLQAPNRAGVWSRSQQPREKAMVGPRFEQTIMQHQVRC